MFGELGNSDIHDNEPNYGFDEFYNGDNGYSSDNDRLASSQEEELWDVGSYDSASAQDMPADNNIQQNDVLQQNVDNQNPAPQQYAGNEQGQNEQPATPKKKSGSFIYLLLLLFVFAAAAGMFFYKKNMASDSGAQTEQSMGDYFYDKASADAGNASPSAANEPTATVDVNLSESLPARPEEAAAPDKAAAPADADGATTADEAQKKLTPLEKAMLKKKADEQKESQTGLASGSVIVPVSAGGRVDPFMPYMQKEALAKQPKFELIAPPTTIPEADPVVDELVQTKISGIMYDQARPSAIVNFGGEDQLVHKGDIVKGYNIVNITKNSVVIKYKNNIYQATVGQSLDDGVNLNPVSGLSNQFGGVYNKSAGSVIQFNE